MYYDSPVSMHYSLKVKLVSLAGRQKIVFIVNSFTIFVALRHVHNLPGFLTLEYLYETLSLKLCT